MLKRREKKNRTWHACSVTCISTITGLYATFTPRTYFCSAYVTRVRVPLQCSLSVVFGAQFNCRRTVAFVLNHAFTMLHMFSLATGLPFVV